MAYTAVPTYTTGELITASHGNTYWRDNFAYLKSAVDDNTTKIAKIYSGRVASDGSAVKLPSGWSSSRTATGKYQITHNLGTTDYTITALANGKHSLYSNKASNTIDIYSLGYDNDTKVMGFYDAQVEFIIVKD